MLDPPADHRELLLELLEDLIPDIRVIGYDRERIYGFAGIESIEVGGHELVYSAGNSRGRVIS